jgi:hypothetical protein
MQTKYKKIVKSLVIGIIIFLIINQLDGEFYNYHMPTLSPILKFYFYPILILADLINSIIPIDATVFHKTLLNPHYYYFPFPKTASGTIFLPGVYTLIVGITWTSLLVYIYTSAKRFKKIPTPFRIILYILAVIILTYLSSIISQLLFGPWYPRVCPGCP